MLRARAWAAGDRWGVSLCVPAPPHGRGELPGTGSPQRGTDPAGRRRPRGCRVCPALYEALEHRGGEVCERSAHSAPRPAQLRAAGPLPKLPVPGRLLEPPPTRNRQGRACHRFRANEARLLLGVIAYNLAICYNALPLAIQGWSLSSLRQRLFKTGGRLIRHARYFVLQLAESRLTGILFRQIVARIERLVWHPT